MIANGIQSPVLSQPGGPATALSRGIQNKVAAYSDAAAAASIAALNDRTEKWNAMGVWVGASPPGTAITYAAWVAGGTGYWGWKTIP
jgi:hypothetical protein